MVFVFILAIPIVSAEPSVFLGVYFSIKTYCSSADCSSLSTKNKQEQTRERIIMTKRIIQFGTSRFLQAHVDLFVHEARQAGQAVGPIAVVQASASAARAGRFAAFGQPEGYPVVIRGLEAGRPVERTVTVTSVDRGLA